MLNQLRGFLQVYQSLDICIGGPRIADWAGCLQRTWLGVWRNVTWVSKIRLEWFIPQLTITLKKQLKLSELGRWLQFPQIHSTDLLVTHGMYMQPFRFYILLSLPPPRVRIHRNSEQLDFKVTHTNQYSVNCLSLVAFFYSIWVKLFWIKNLRGIL